jgi:putative ABC transport system permease protein
VVGEFVLNLKMLFYLWQHRQLPGQEHVGHTNTFFSMHIFKQSFRLIRRNGPFSLINFTGLILGFFVLMGIGAYVLGELSYDAFHSQANRIYRVTMDINDNQYAMHWARQNISYINSLEDEFSQIDHLIRFQDYYPRDVRVGEEVYRIPNAYTTDAQVFQVFDFKLLAGDPVSALAQPYSVVLTESTAKRFYGRTDVLGELMEFTDNTGMERHTYKVTGLMEDLPENSHMPVNLLTSFASEDDRTGWAYTYLLINKPGDHESIAAAIPEFVKKYGGEEDFATLSFPLQNLRDIHISGGLAREIQPVNNRSQLILFTSVGILVFVLTLINYLNLHTTQVMRRQGEMGMRRILGAANKHINLQMIAETSIVVLGSAAIAVIGYITVQEQIQEVLPGRADLRQVMPFILLAAFITIILSSWFPITLLSKNSIQIKKKGGSLGFSTFSVGFQMVLCCIMVSAALIASKQFNYVSSKDLGVSTSQVVALKDLAEPVKQRKKFIKEQLRQLPAIEQVSAVMEIPSREIRDAGPVMVRSKSWTEEEAPVMDVQVVDNTFFEMMQMEVLAGHPFIEELPEAEMGDDYFAYIQQVPREYVINETALRQMGFERPEEAIGELMNWRIGSLVLADGPIIGVVKDYHQESLRNNVEPLIFVQEPVWTRHILVKIVPGATSEALADVKDFWDQHFSEYPLETVFLDDMYAQLYASDERQVRLMRSFSILAIIISFLGIFGLLSFVVRSREKELAIRKVLGASTASITHLISKRFLLIAGAGTLISLPLTWYLMQKWLEGFAYRIPLTLDAFVVSLIVISSVFLLVVLLQTRRIVRHNPADILRAE